MATPQLSPGVLTREVDLTVGRADNVLDNIGAIAGPFSIGPVGEVTNIATENELLNVFGQPLSTDRQYEYWMSAASYLSYGGVLKVVRTDGTELKNANAGVNTTTANTELKIKNFEDYNSQDTADYYFAAKNPGSWGNGLKVCAIDGLADQILTFKSSNLGISLGISSSLVGYGLTVSVATATAGAASTERFSGYLKAIVTGISTTASVTSVSAKIVSRVSSGGTETRVDYAQYDRASSFEKGDSVYFIANNGVSAGSTFVVESLDWYNEQTLNISGGTVYWKSIAPKPSTTQYATERSSYNDEIHVVVVDDTGSLTGIQGNIIEKHVGLSKALDSVSSVNSPTKNWYRDYLSIYSENIYAGGPAYATDDSVLEIKPASSGFTSTTGNVGGFQPISKANGAWGLNAQSKTFNVVGNLTFELKSGKDYGTSGVGMNADLGDLITAYDLFSNSDEVEVDYLICGPGLDDKFESQAKAKKLIAIAKERKDCVAVISPNRTSVINVANSNTQTNNIVEFFEPIDSSSYAIFDSGYKYTYDRFNNTFRYIPCNADVAGLMARTSLNSYPWFSPAGQQRGVLNNAIKLAYNPNKSQRDILYQARINSIISQPGIGILLFGDKTGLGYASAFDRINVRRLFLTVEQALKRSAEAQLFELNDQVTRANFVNIVEPYLRDVQAKRGIYDFLVICDETNNTPDIIDNNEFRADIFLKPTKSINYVTLTFVATRTGISFEEVAGRV